MVRRNGKKEAIGNCSELMMHCEDSEKLNARTRLENVHERNYGYDVSLTLTYSN